MRTILAAGIAVLAVGCGSSSSGGRTTVVAAFYPLAYAAEQVGGRQVAVTNLTPPGAEPHDVELTPREIGELQRADIVIFLSHGFQPAVEQAAAGASGKRVDVLVGLPLHAAPADEVGNDDPHAWLDPVLYARVITRIGSALGRPQHAAALAARVRALDRTYRHGLERCAGRSFVTSHAAFGYLAARYGLEQVPIAGVDPASEPSAQRLAALVRLVRRRHVHTVFFERLVSPELAQTLARETGAKTAVLDPIEGLTPAEAAAGATYFSLMRQNLDRLRTALGCR